MAAPVVVGATAGEARSLWEQLPPERQATTTPSTPDQAAEQLRPYLDAGFTGFTFNNNVYPRPEQIAAIGELLRLVA